jgi:hypothetical protein
MERFINQQGRLTAEGKAYVNEYFGKAVDDLLKIATTDNQTRLIGSVLNSIIGDKIANLISNKGEGK